MQFKQQTADLTFIFTLLTLQFLALVQVASLMWLKGSSQSSEGTLQLYYEYSTKLMQGQIPYRDFPLEYPPLALLPMLLPHLFKFGHPVSFHNYIWLFMLESSLFSILMALVLVQIMSRLRPGLSPVMVLRSYSLLVIISSPLLLWRYDLFPALLTQLALLCILIGRPTQAGIWLGFGVAAKLYPVVLLPIFSCYYLVKRQYRKLLGLLLGTAGATFISLLPFVLIAPDKLLSFLRYHQLRGLQIESIAAGGISLMHVLGLTEAKWIYNYGAFHIVSPLADPVIGWLPLLFILAIAGVTARCLFRFRWERATKGAVGESLAIYCVAALLAFIITGKVFSTQYIIWLLPFAPLLRPKQVCMVLAIFVMTIIIYPFNYSRLLDMQALPVLLLNLRNILTVILLGSLLVDRHLTSAPKPIKQRPTPSLVR